MSEELPFDPLLPERAWTVCFYSYRGGVGRTTLAVDIVNVFHGLRVADDLRLGAQDNLCLLADFDLEAPGVDEFYCMRASDPNQPGLVEYISEYLRLREDPPLQPFVYAPQGQGGPLVMRAGRRDAEYLALLGRLNWWDFYREHDGDTFLRNLQVAVSRELGCRTLLVDSRPGHSEIAGVCMGCLADAVILVFQPSTAHADGMAQAVAAVRERERREERVIPRLYVANKVEQVYEEEVTDDVRSLTESLVRRCEGKDIEIRDNGAGYRRKPLGPDGRGDWEAYGVWPGSPGPEPGVAQLFYLPLRTRLRNQHQPDSFLRSGAASARCPDLWILELGAWIHAARRFAADDVQDRSIQRAYDKLLASRHEEDDWRAFFHSIPQYEFEAFLSAWPVWRKNLESLPQDKLAWMLPESHVQILGRGCSPDT